jgi:thymidylate synthase (FAD)
MPNEHYIPELGRIQRQSLTNKQGSGGSFPPEEAANFIGRLETAQQEIYSDYDEFVRKGIAKEVARINTPVSRYSKMRAKTDLRNWLWFLGLRMEKGAQWEIRQYANAVASIIKKLWPKTFDLFIEHDFLSVRFSRSEMDALRKLLGKITRGFMTDEVPIADPKKRQAFLDKLMAPKEDDYKDVLTKLGY